jgi:hypothetical protein
MAGVNLRGPIQTIGAAGISLATVSADSSPSSRREATIRGTPCRCSKPAWN